MEEIGDIVLAAILVVNGELALHVEHLPDRPQCLARIEALRDEGKRVHRADCTAARELGLAKPELYEATTCFIFNGQKICDREPKPESLVCGTDSGEVACEEVPPGDK